MNRTPTALAAAIFLVITLAAVIVCARKPPGSGGEHFAFAPFGGGAYGPDVGGYGDTFAGGARKI
jgi:hypothetical protein